MNYLQTKFAIEICILNMEEIKELGQHLKSIGWPKLKYRKKIPESAGTIDVIAQSGGLKKKNLLLIISTDIYDAQIAIMLFSGLPKKYNYKIIYLEEGDPFFVEHPKDVMIVTKTDDLPSA